MSAAGPGLAITLRDIHVPPDVAVWPLAPGWWIVIGLVGGGIAASIAWLAWRRARRRPLRILALRELAVITAPGFGDAFAQLVALRGLLRRLGHACPGGAVQLADLRDGWMDWLSRRSGLPGCPPAVAAQVARIPFQPPRVVDVQPLIAQTRAIIRGMPAWRSGRGPPHAG